jgi:adenosylhomocysteine nucleosidase
MMAIDRFLEGRAAAQEARASRRGATPVDAVVLCAMGEELAPFLEDSTDPVELEAPGSSRAIRATVAGKDLVLVRTRVGLVNAAIAATWALVSYAPRVLISAGSAGGLHADVEVGDVIVSESLAAARAAGVVARSGLVLSGDAFVTAANVDAYRTDFPTALSTDMESTAIAQVAADSDTPMISIRGISDLCGPAANQDFHMEVDHVAAVSARVVLGMLHS